MISSHSCSGTKRPISKRNSLIAVIGIVCALFATLLLLSPVVQEVDLFHFDIADFLSPEPFFCNLVETADLPALTNIVFRYQGWERSSVSAYCTFWVAQRTACLYHCRLRTFDEHKDCDVDNTFSGYLWSQKMNPTFSFWYLNTTDIHSSRWCQPSSEDGFQSVSLAFRVLPICDRYSTR